jgi:hypothetical protein
MQYWRVQPSSCGQGFRTRRRFEECCGDSCVDMLAWPLTSHREQLPYCYCGCHLQFATTLNALPGNLRPHICPTNTRLRPNQRVMEDGEYDFAAAEKNRLEEKQRAKRGEREEQGEIWEPRWFKALCEVTGEEFWELQREE